MKLDFAVGCFCNSILNISNVKFHITGLRLTIPNLDFKYFVKTFFLNKSAARGKCLFLHIY